MAKKTEPIADDSLLSNVARKIGQAAGALANMTSSFASGDTATEPPAAAPPKPARKKKIAAKSSTGRGAASKRRSAVKRAKAPAPPSEKGGQEIGPRKKIAAVSKNAANVPQSFGLQHPCPR